MGTSLRMFFTSQIYTHTNTQFTPTLSTCQAIYASAEAKLKEARGEHKGSSSSSSSSSTNIDRKRRGEEALLADEQAKKLKTKDGATPSSGKGQSSPSKKTAKKTEVDKLKEMSKNMKK